MVRRATRAAKDSEPEQTSTAPETIRIRRALDELCDARCPLCRMVLVARQGRAGPGFFCRCPKKRAA
jgi:hypothetical protein